MAWLNDFWTLEMVDAWAPVLADRKGRIAQRIRYEAMPEEVRIPYELALGQAIVPGLMVTGAWVVPVLSPEACDRLVELTEDFYWAPNEEEDPEYQIPEVVLQEQDPLLDQQLKDVLYLGLAPWILGIWGRLPTQYASVQMTRYEPHNTAKGNYHIDQDADYTAVIALNDDFVGGGTGIVDGLLGEVHLPPVPKGYALIFDGRRVHHKGLPVLEGTRQLLTVWANNDGDQY